MLNSAGKHVQSNYKVEAEGVEQGMGKEKKTKMKEIVFKKKKNGGGKCCIAIQWKVLQIENYNALLFISNTCFQLVLCLKFSLGYI